MYKVVEKTKWSNIVKYYTRYLMTSAFSLLHHQIILIIYVVAKVSWIQHLTFI